jgi:hypothetical protein
MASSIDQLHPFAKVSLSLMGRPASAPASTIEEITETSASEPLRNLGHAKARAAASKASGCFMGGNPVGCDLKHRLTILEASRLDGNHQPMAANGAE